MCQENCRRFHRAYACGSLRLVKRIHALLALAEGTTVHDVAQMLALGEQTVRDYRNQFLWQGVASLVYQRSPGRPSKLTKTQRQALAAWLESGPQASGYASGCWSASLIQDLISRCFGMMHHTYYICTLLDTLGFLYQKARFVLNHLDRLNRATQHWYTGSAWKRVIAVCHGHRVYESRVERFSPPVGR
jgi:transposase